MALKETNINISIAARLVAFLGLYKVVIAGTSLVYLLLMIGSQETFPMMRMTYLGIDLLTGVILISIGFYIYKQKQWALNAGLILSLIGTVYYGYVAFVMFMMEGIPGLMFLIYPGILLTILILLGIGIRKVPS